MQVKVTRVSKRDTDKNGNKLVGKKYGKPYWNIGIQIEGQEGWMSGFANNTSDPMYNIEEGGTYHISVTEKNVDGKVFKNFRLLKPEEMKLAEMEAELAELRKLKAQPYQQQDAENGMNDLEKF